MSYIRKTKIKHLKNFGLDFFGRIYRKKKYIVLKESDNKKNKTNLSNLKPINKKVVRQFFYIYRNLVLKENVGFYEQYKTLITKKFLNLKITTKIKYKNQRYFLKKRRTRFLYLNKRKFMDYTVFRQRKIFFEKLTFFKEFQWFYGRMSRIRIKKLFLNFNKSKQNTINEFIFLLESRLDVFLFKCGFFSSILEAKTQIRLGKVLLNNKKILKNSNILIKPNEIISINKKHRIYFFKQMLKRLNSNFIFYIEPHYAEINYSTMSAVLLKNNLTWNNLKFPLNFKLLFIKNIFKFL